MNALCCWFLRTGVRFSPPPPRITVQQIPRSSPARVSSRICRYDAESFDPKFCTFHHSSPIEPMGCLAVTKMNSVPQPPSAAAGPTSPPSAGVQNGCRRCSHSYLPRPCRIASEWKRLRSEIRAHTPDHMRRNRGAGLIATRYEAVRLF